MVCSTVSPLQRTSSVPMSYVDVRIWVMLEIVALLEILEILGDLVGWAPSSETRMTFQYVVVCV